MPKNTSERIIDAGGAAYVPGVVGITVGGAARRGLHTLATVDGLGAEHSVFGLTAGQVLRATGAATAAFAAIDDTDLPATIVRTSRSLTAGAGLTGGGDLSADRSFAVGAGLGITVNADDVALTTPGSLTATSTNSSTGSHTHAIDATIARAAITLTAGAGLTGGGDLSANRTLAVGAGLGITVNADDVALTTPGSLTATSTNSSTGSHTHAIDATIARSAITLTAGAGLTGGGDLSANRTLAVGAGTMITVNADDVAITAGANYQFIGTGSGTAAGWRNVSELAGAGLTHATGVLAVGAGLGITVNADDVALTTPGSLTATSTNSSTGSHTHAIDATIARAAITLTAGAGLTGGGDLSANRTFAVGAGLGITVNADDVALASSAAGAGLTYISGVLAVGAGLGITVNADDVALTTPGSLTVSTTNSSSGSHTHAITSSSNPGAAASILASDSSGYLRLVRLGVGMAPTRQLDVTGDIGVSGTLYADGGLIDFGTDYFQEGASYLDLKGAKPLQLDQTIQANGGGWSITKAGGATFAGDLAVGTSVLTVNVAGTRVGINRTPDAQFSLDVAGAIRGDYLVGKHAIQLNSAVAVCHYDGPGPNNLDFSGTTHSHLGIEASTITGGVIYRTGKFGKGVQLAAASTNLYRNPSAETNTTDWDCQYGTLTRSDEQSYIGSYSFKCVATSTSDMAFYDTHNSVTSPAAGAAYTLSAWIFASGTTIGKTLTALCREQGGATAIESTSVAYVLVAGWQRVFATRTVVRSDRTIVDGNFTLSATASGDVLYFDGVQMEASAWMTPYCDGSLGGGHSWGGTAHASTSSRTATALAYNVAGWLNGDEGTIMLWARHDGMNTVGLALFGSGASGEFDAWMSTSGGLRFRQAGVDLIAGTATMTTWNHYAFSWSRSGNSRSIYLNGVLAGSRQFDAGATLGSTLVVGALSAVAGYNLNGLLDEFVLLDYSADPKLIRSIYESDAPVFVESSVHFYRSPSPAPIWVDEFGLWAKSSAGNAILGVYAGDPRRVAASKAWGGLDLEDNDILIGRSTDGYVHWDDSAQTLNVAGTITAQAGSITGALTLGASGGIYQGTGTFASPTTGLKIWNDVGAGGIGRIGGYNGGTLQWYAGTDGKLYATGGQIGGWTLGANTLSATDITLSSGGVVTVGSGNSVIKMVSTDPSELFWAGHANYSSAPFRISPQGYFYTEGATFLEVGSTPVSPLTQDTMAQIYLKGDKLIVRFDNAGTARYKYLDLTGTGVTWVHSTSAP